MAFTLKTGKPEVEWYPKTASTAISANAVLEQDGSGAVNPADSADTSLFGVSLRAVVAADSDYATAGAQIPVLVMNPSCTWEADVTTGTATAAMVGLRRDLDTSLGINVNGTSHNQVTIVGFISASKVVVRFNSSYQFVNAA